MTRWGGSIVPATEPFAYHPPNAVATQLVNSPPADSGRTQQLTERQTVSLRLTWGFRVRPACRWSAPPVLVDVQSRPRRAPQERRSTALNIFIGVSTNENTGRESEAPAELFRPRDRPQVLVDAKWPPNKAPQERRSPVMMDRTIKRCLELWRRPPDTAR